MNVERATEQMLENELRQMNVSKASKATPGFQHVSDDEYEEEFKCDICKKKFKSLGMLSSHLDSRDHIKKEKKWTEINGKTVTADTTSTSTAKHGTDKTEKDEKTENLPSKKQAKADKNAKKASKKTQEVEVAEEKAEVTDEVKESKGSKKGKGESKKKEKELETEEGSKAACKLCKKMFESRRKLFDHLEVEHGYDRKK